ncbi:hypothetical protein ACFL2Q_17920, partial [Thermodesulfobacteriota bacterium]
MIEDRYEKKQNTEKLQESSNPEEEVSDNSDCSQTSTDAVHVELECIVVDETESEQQEDIESDSFFDFLLRGLLRLGFKLIIDQFNGLWASIPQIAPKGTFRNIKLKSKAFKMFVIEAYFRETKVMLRNSIVEQFLIFIEIKAFEIGECLDLSVRAAWLEGKILLDRGSPDWSVIAVSPDGPRILQGQRSPFQRPRSLRPLPDPDVNAGPEMMFDLLEVLPNLDEKSRHILIVWIVTVLIPAIPRPSLVIHGDPGSGKSFMCEILRRLVDP